MDNQLQKIDEKQVTIQTQVDNLLAGRQYFIEKVLPILKENQDYYTILNKKSLAKGGAEKLASIFNFTASFTMDKDTTELLKQEGLVAFICDLKDKDGNHRGQGRGADSLARNRQDANKTIKMAQKRAYVDAVIRATGLSDIFTQDLEDMDKSELKATKKVYPTYNKATAPQRVKSDDPKKKEIKDLCSNLEPLLTSGEDYKKFVMDKTGMELLPENYDAIISTLKGLAS